MVPPAAAEPELAAEPEPQPPPKKRHRSTAAEMALKRLVASKETRSEKKKRAARARWYKRDPGQTRVAEAATVPTLALVPFDAAGVVASIDTESQALACAMMSSDSTAQKGASKSASTYALLWKKLQRNKTLTNFAEDIGKSRWSIKRMLTSTAASCRICSIGRALKAIQEFEHKLKAQHDDVIALDWVTKMKYDEMTLTLTVPTVGPSTVTQSAPELVKIMQITV